jgi:flagellar hook-basal body complex protein FliE
MVVNPLESGQKFSPLVQQLQGGALQEPQPSGNFTDTLKDFISDVNTFQTESADLDAKLIKGEPVDLHDVMIATEKAKTSFQMLVEIRNKFLDLYQQVNRMQI